MSYIHQKQLYITMAPGMEIGRATNTGREINSRHSEMEAKLIKVDRQEQPY